MTKTNTKSIHYILDQVFNIVNVQNIFRCLWILFTYKIFTCDFSSYPFFWKLCHKHYNWKGIGFHLCYDFVHESKDCIVCWTILNIFCSRRFQQQLEIFFGQNAGLQMDMDVQQTLFKSKNRRCGSGKKISIRVSNSRTFKSSTTILIKIRAIRSCDLWK